MASPLICASIATCPHLAVLEHDDAQSQQALGDAAGFMHVSAGRAAPQDQRHQLLVPSRATGLEVRHGLQLRSALPMP